MAARKWPEEVRRLLRRSPTDSGARSSGDAPSSEVTDAVGGAARALAGELANLGDLVDSRIGSVERTHILSTNAMASLRQSAADERSAEPGAGRAAAPAVPGTLVTLDDAVLADQRARYRDGEPDVVAVVADLVARAEKSLTGPLYSVTEKTTLPPSGDLYDYWSVAPYWWPNPATPDGLPYVRRDGERAPGTTLWGPGSEQYDRSSLQSMIDETTISSLAGYFAGQALYLRRGADLLRHWFLNPATSMNPHLTYSQVRRGHGGDQGSGPSIIDTKDFYYLLDAARLLEREGALTPTEGDALRDWFAQYRLWLRESAQGLAACAATNNLGTWYDVQMMAINIYLDDMGGVTDMLRRVESRVGQQFAPDGSQPKELTRTLSLHYSAYNLQAWLVLIAMARRAGHDLWSVTTPTGASAAAAVRALLRYLTEPWPYQQTSPFDRERLVVLAHETARDLSDDTSAEVLHGAERNPWRVRQVFAATEGIRPYWLLGWR